MESTESALIAEQLTHAIDLLRAEIASLRADLEHHRELSNSRLTNLEDCQKDHEARIRATTEGVTQFKMFSGISSGGATLISIFTMLKVILGGP